LHFKYRKQNILLEKTYTGTGLCKYGNKKAYISFSLEYFIACHMLETLSNYYDKINLINSTNALKVNAANKL